MRHALRLRLSRAARVRPKDVPAVRVAASAPPTASEAYWREHTVNSTPFRSARDSERYLEWRFAEYPCFRELMELWGDHDGETILDYGCGPGDDLVGFLLYTGARRVIGVDVSPRALELARHRIGLHRVDLDRVELVRASDAEPSIPLADASVDFVNCGGVLHHTSHPEALLAELARVLRPGARANVMVYNRDSVYFHLHVAYVRMLLEDAFPRLSAEEAFARSTDGEECPISRCYRPAEFLALCEAAGLRGEFAGGYLSRWDLGALSHLDRALADERLAAEHEDFLRALQLDEQGRPFLDGRPAGIGGTYRLTRA